jgi:hypothetical protein
MAAGWLQIVLYTNKGSYIEQSAMIIGAARKACQAQLDAVGEIPGWEWRLEALAR